MIRSERPTRVLLADDNLPVREGLKRLINEEPDMEVVAETGDGQEALQLAQRIAPDVALVDVSMPGWDGVRLARAMSGACPSLRIIAVTGYGQPSDLVRSRDAGFDDHVVKPVAIEVIERILDDTGPRT